MKNMIIYSSDSLICKAALASSIAVLMCWCVRGGCKYRWLRPCSCVRQLWRLRLVHRWASWRFLLFESLLRWEDHGSSPVSLSDLTPLFSEQCLRCRCDADVSCRQTQRPLHPRWWEIGEPRTQAQRDVLSGRGGEATASMCEWSWSRSAAGGGREPPSETLRALDQHCVCGSDSATASSDPSVWGGSQVLY